MKDKDFLEEYPPMVSPHATEPSLSLYHRDFVAVRPGKLGTSFLWKYQEGIFQLIFKKSYLI